MTEAKAHEQCSCSKHRQCAMHRHQMRAITRKPQEEHRKARQQQALEDGIAALRQKYGAR